MSTPSWLSRLCSPARPPALPMAAAPSRCEVCRGWNGDGICGECLERFAPPVTRCICCGLRLALPAPRCGRCLREPPPFEHTVCALDYVFPWDTLVQAFKFQDRPELAPALAALLADAVRRDAEAGLGRPPDLVVPVPLARERLATRGFNQAWELARHAAAALGLAAAPDLLLRTLSTAQQAELSRAERERNLRAAFAPSPSSRARLEGRRVALVDDVMTTGATAREATFALQRGGAAAVDLWVLARTPDVRA